MTLSTVFAPKPRKCAHCEGLFVPVRPMQKVCGPVCAAKRVRAQKVEERAQVRTRKEQIKTIPVLIREAQTAFNAWIRARDAKQPCITCGAPPPDMSQLHAGRDAGHYRSTGAAAHLRFNEANCHAQCVECNRWKAGKAVEYRRALIARIGLEAVEALEDNNEPRKWVADELRGIREMYRRRLREMPKEEA